LISSGKNTIEGLNILLIHQPAFDRPTSAIAADSIESLLLSSPLHVDHCSDVYRGLARLGQSGSKIYDIAIICVDGLSTMELEFFSIVARRYPHISVYVYCRLPSRVRLDRAIELGAAGLASAELIRSLVATQSTTPPDPKNIQTETLQSQQQLVAGETPHEPIDEPAEKTTSAPEITRDEIADDNAESRHIATPNIEVVDNDEFEVEDDDYDLEEETDGENHDEPAGPARVPWMRYQNTPTRQAPQPQSVRQPPRTHDTVNDKPRIVPRRNIDEPLLTDEELEALIGDDISAIVPNERDALVSDDSTDEENVT